MWTFGKSRWLNRPPSIPDGVRIYTVGDVHGRADLLKSVLSRIDQDVRIHPVRKPIEVFLGDYVDRGPASREVLDILIARGRSRRSVFLKGNHEAYIFDFLQNPETLTHWRSLGGFETLLSYGLRPHLSFKLRDQQEIATQFDSVLPQIHRQWLAGLKLCFSCGDYFFVHAGVRPGVPLEHQTESDLLLIREDFLHCEDDFTKFIVHGHTPVAEPDLRSNRINIDTGAYASGRLTCLVIEGVQVHLI